MQCSEKRKHRGGHRSIRWTREIGCMRTLPFLAALLRGVKKAAFRVCRCLLLLREVSLESTMVSPGSMTTAALLYGLTTDRIGFLYHINEAEEKLDDDTAAASSN